MSGKPSKSLWEITTAQTHGTPASTDLVLFAPQPGTAFVTECKQCTVAELIAGGGGGAALTATQVGFGSSLNVLTGSPELTFDPIANTLFGLLSLGESSILNGYLAQMGNETSDWFSSIGAILRINAALLNATNDGSGIGIEANVTAHFSDAGTISEMSAIKSTVNALPEHGQVTVASSIHIFASATPSNDAVVLELNGLLVDTVSGATVNNAIQTKDGDIVFGTLAGVGTRPVMVDANGKLSA